MTSSSLTAPAAPLPQRNGYASRWIGTPANDAFITRLMHYSMLLFCSTAITTGPYRAALAVVKLTPLVYIPTIGLLVLFFVQVVHDTLCGRMTRTTLFYYVMFFSAIGTGITLLPLTQALFGVYVLLPFFFGLVSSKRFFTDVSSLRKAATILWFLATVGVIVNNFLTYPWEGFSYEVGGVSVETSREWEVTGGGKRLAGLSRASFDAAIQIQILAIIMVLMTRNFFWTLVIWSLSGVAIVLTTAKGIYNVFAVLTPIVLLGPRIPESWLRYGAAFFVLAGTSLPLSTLAVRYDAQIRDPAIANLAFSFLDRLQNMWPEAWALILHYGHPVFGRGFGGIGTAQAYFEPLLVNAGDNIYVYWTVILGWPGLLVILPLAFSVVLLRPWTRSEDHLPFLLTMATMVYGLTTNVVENSFFAMTCGLAVAHLSRRLVESFHRVAPDH